MAKLTYLLLTLGTLLAAYAMGVYWRQEWLSRFTRSMTAVSVVATVFIGWDLAAVHLGHWSFNVSYRLGTELFGLPLEEYLFFITVSFASLAVWQKLRVMYGNRRISMAWLALPLIAAISMYVVWGGRTYTLLVSLATVCISLLLYAFQTDLLTRSWAIYQIVLLGLFAVFNGLLTSLPITVYNPMHFSTVRIGSIPIEDFLYNFVLINSVIIAYRLICGKADRR